MDEDPTTEGRDELRRRHRQQLRRVEELLVAHGRLAKQKTCGRAKAVVSALKQLLLEDREYQREMAVLDELARQRFGRPLGGGQTIRRQPRSKRKPSRDTR